MSGHSFWQPRSHTFNDFDWYAGIAAQASKICVFITDIFGGMKWDKVRLEKRDADGDMAVVAEGHILSSARWFALPSAQKSKLFVRQCYEALLQKINAAWNSSDQYHVLLIGTPGTSKTFFLNYVAYDLLSKKRDFHVVICHDSGVVSIDPNNIITPGENLNEFNALLQLSQTVVLYDCSKTNSNPPHWANAKVLAVSSPNKEQYKYYTKSFCKTFCMPLWSLDELELCRQKCFQSQSLIALADQEADDVLYCVSAIQLECRYNLWGGVIRWTIGSQSRESESEFEKALTGMDLKAAKMAVGSFSQLDFKGADLTHRLIHADTQDMETFQCKFCSQEACEKTIQRLIMDTEKQCMQFLVDTRNQSIYASLRGQVFEAYAHRILEKKESIEVRFLDGDQKTEEIKLGSRNLLVFDDLKPLGENVYGVPKIKNFAAVDSLAAPDLAFSMTVSLDHPTVASGLLKILPAIQRRNILVFVVPSEIAAAFKKQNYLRVDKKVMEKLPPSIKEIRQAVMAIKF